MGPVPRQRNPEDADDALVEAVRAGRADPADPVAQILAALRACATGSCSCPARGACVVAEAGRTAC